MTELKDGILAIDYPVTRLLKSTWLEKKLKDRLFHFATLSDK